MKAKKDSILFIFASYQIVIVFIVFFFFMVNGLFLYSAERSNMIKERSYQLEMAIEKVNNRINALDHDVLEILTTVISDHQGLMSDNAGVKSLDKQKINQILRNKRLMSDYLEFIYVFRNDDFMVFQGREDISIYNHLDLKEYIEINAEEIVSSTRRDRWQICDIQGNAHVIKCYRYAASNLYVGVAATPDVFFHELTVLAQDCNGAYWVSNDDMVSYEYRTDIKTNALGAAELDPMLLQGGMTVTARFEIGLFEFFRNNMIANLVLALVLCLMFVFIMNNLIKKKIIYPVKEISQAVQNIDDLSEQKKIPDNAEVSEIRGLEKVLNTLLQEVVYSRMKAYTTELQKKEQEMALMRSQIRPHFFLNAITTISMMTYQNRNDDIRKYLMRLSTFMRYVITSAEEWVSLGEELENIKNYSEMQEIRFPDSVMLFTECAPEAAKVQIPRYLLLTIVENSYKYAMGESDVMQILVEASSYQEEGFEGILISIEDNGKGFEEEQLAYYNRQEELPESKDQHIGLMNVKKTLSLSYGRGDLLRISNAVPNGARFEILIPTLDVKGEINEDSDSR